MILDRLANSLRIREVALMLLLEVVCEPGLCEEEKKRERYRKKERELVVKICSNRVRGAPRTISLST